MTLTAKSTPLHAPTKAHIPTSNHIHPTLKTISTTPHTHKSPLKYTFQTPIPSFPQHYPINPLSSTFLQKPSQSHRSPLYNIPTKITPKIQPISPTSQKVNHIYLPITSVIPYTIYMYITNHPITIPTKPHKYPTQVSHIYPSPTPFANPSLLNIPHST